MPAVKTLAKGQIVIPAKLRRKYHIRPGARLELLEYGGIIYLIPPSRISSRLRQASSPASPPSPRDC